MGINPTNAGKPNFTKARIVFGLSIVGFGLFFILAVVSAVKSGNGQAIYQAGVNLAREVFAKKQADLSEEQVNRIKDAANTNSIEVIINTNVLPTPTATPTTKSKTVIPVKTCYRYTVVHLDNSKSNLCYSKDDYSVLTNLGSKLSSARSFLQFHLDMVVKYQSEYERTGSSVYLNAKASAEADAARERDKVGIITGQMQEIEKRGW